MNLFSKLFTFNIYFLYIYDIKTTRHTVLVLFQQRGQKVHKAKSLFRQA